MRKKPLFFILGVHQAEGKFCIVNFLHDPGFVNGATLSRGDFSASSKAMLCIRRLSFLRKR